MITSADFNEQLKQFFTKPSSEIKGLDEVVRHYPYFQLARVMQINRPMDDAEKANLAFVYENREFLYKLIQAGHAGEALLRQKNEEEGDGDNNRELSFDELVQQFIANPPKISKISEDLPEAEVYDDLGKSSSIERMNIVSETLAKIYVNQKELDRAIKIYKVLMEKHPEKSATFAKEIENIKSLKS